ncbi:hypothetical protein R5R35_013717 [Gryllus longicercus]|uniref:C2H2-type domain-containing protein n=1 Tax=Gryllus longicercus TaxID=2509291 RepID=A0AAN9ZCL2_9ORTH
MDTSVSCPVCTLYLREGVSLQTHLNTHPKDQVIEALLKYCGPGREGNAQNEMDSMLAAQYTGEQNEPALGESTESGTSQQYPSSSSHFTAAVTYQQFMSSNASVGGAVMPQCFSVPAIIAAPAGEMGTAAVMPLLYNPYILQQQQQQLQFYNAFRTVPQQPLTRQILPPSALFPISPQFSIAASGNPVFQNNIPVSSSSAAVLQNGDNIQSNSSIFLSSISNGCQEAKRNEKDQAIVPSTPELPKYRDVEDKQCSPKHISQCSDSQETQEADQVQDLPNNSANVREEYEENINNQIIVPSPTGAKNDCSNSAYGSDRNEKMVSNSCDKGCANEDGNVCMDDITGASDVLFSPVSPNLRVRTDLSKVSSEAKDEPAGGNSSELENACVDVIVHEERNSMSAAGEKCNENEGWGFLSETDKNGSVEICPVDSAEKDSAEYITSDIYTDGAVCEVESQPSEAQVPTTVCRDSAASMEGRHFKVVDIEGIHVLVPTHFLATEGDQAQSDNREAVLKPSSQQSRCGDQTTDCDTDVSAVANQDIQTDEVMPPMGELSGQESLGENDISSWSQEKDDVTTSYDLLAREKWEASDGSDAENDGDLGASPVPTKLLKVATGCPPLPLTMPLASPPLASPPATSPASVSPLPTAPPPPPPQTTTATADDAKPKKKRREKLRCVYKCWTCDETFTCPKERRVHQSEKHAGPRVGGPGAEAKAEPWQSDTAHSPAPRDSPADADLLGRVKEEQGEDCKAGFKSEALALAQAAAADEDDDLDELKPGAFDEERLKGVKDLEEQPGADENAFKFICSRCENVFSSAKSLHRHVRTVHGQSQFTCRTCGEKFPSEPTYLAHLKIHPLECSRCGKYFYRHQNLNLHIRRHLGIKPFKCSICDKSFVTKQKLAEHTNTHTGNTPIKCNLCSETFRRYSNLIQHKNRHHLKLKKKVKDFICHCGEVFHSQKKLLWHKEIHDEKPKTCSYCSERFVHASSLTRHIRKAHDQRYFPCTGREAENVECPVCGCVFLKSSLAVHMRLHSGQRPFSCHICGKSFSTKWNLQLHRWTHAARSLKPFKCSLCKSAFIRHSEYTAHMHSHRNVRPYTCNYCGSQFIRKYNCIRHAREHEGEKAFSCDVCHKAFHRRYYLKEHMRIHSGARPFACHICGKTSSTKSNHNKHVKIHHAREAVNTEG